MRRLNRSRARAIAIAIPAPKKQGIEPWQAAVIGLITSIAVYAVAALLS
jgi:hypothetical protein